MIQQCVEKRIKEKNEMESIEGDLITNFMKQDVDSYFNVDIDVDDNNDE